MDNMPMADKKCSCPHHKITPVLVVLFGLIFLLEQWGVLSPNTVNTVWPIIVILSGLTLWGVRSGMCNCCDNVCKCC